MAGQSGKNRKYGRNVKSPAAKAYKAEKRAEKRKTRNIAKEMQRIATPKAMKVARGTARAARRVALQRENNNA